MKDIRSHKKLVTLTAVLGFALIAVIFLYIVWRGFDASNRSLTIAQCTESGGLVMGEIAPFTCSLDNKSYPISDTYPAEDLQASDWLTNRVKSGQGGFEVGLPDGWQFVRPLDQDSLYLVTTGTKQPETKPDSPATIVDAPSYGGDSPRVLSLVLGNNFSAPEGEKIDTVHVGKLEHSAAKYRLEYTEGTQAGIGIPRLKGDIDYTYVIELQDGRELRVFYSIYADDSRNLSTTVDSIVRSIYIP